MKYSAASLWSGSATATSPSRSAEKSSRRPRGAARLPLLLWLLMREPWHAATAPASVLRLSRCTASNEGSALVAGASRGHLAAHVPPAWAISPCQAALNDIKISLYPPDAVWHGSSATYFRRADRQFESRGRGNAAAHPGAPCRSRADGFRPDRDSAPVAAPIVAASAAPRRSRPRRTLP